MNNIETVNNIKINLGGTQGPMGITRSEFDALNKGGPAGVYANLAALQSAEDADKTRIYLTTDNGNWNYWNGSSWVSGGVYQAVGIDNNSISIDKLNFMDKKGNIFTTENAETGKAIGDSNIYDNEKNTLSDYLPVEEGETYIFYSVNVALYDSNKAFIKVVKSNSEEAPALNGDVNLCKINIDAGIKYMRLCAPNSAFKNLYLVNIKEPIGTDNYYKLKNINIEKNIISNDIKENIIDTNKLDFFIRKGNLVNQLDYTTGLNFYLYYGYVFKKLNDDSNFSTGFIKVRPNTKYRTFSLRVIYFNKDKEVISGYNISTSNHVEIITTPDDCYYVRLTSDNSTLDSIYLYELGDINTNNKISYLNPKGLESKEAYVKENNLIFVSTKGELFNQNTKLDKVTFFSGDTLTYVESNTEGISDFILIKPNTIYCFYVLLVAWFDENMEFISFSLPTGTEDIHRFEATSPSNAKYARITYNINSLDYITMYEKTEIDKNIRHEIEERTFTTNYDDFLSKPPTMPRLQEEANFDSSFGNECYFLGRWEKRNLSGADVIYTGYTGSKIYTKLQNATNITFNFMGNTSVAYKVNGSEYKYSTGSSFTINNLNSDVDNYIEIVINSLSTNTFIADNGAGFKNIQTDGTAIAVAPKERTVIIYGDSITQGYNIKGDGKTNYELNYANLLSEMLRVRVVPVGIGGIGFTNPGGDFYPVKGDSDYSNSNYIMENSYIDYMRRSKKEQSQYPDFVIVELGTNGNLTNRDDVALNVIKRIQNKYPGIPIFGLIPFNGTNSAILKDVYANCENVITVEANKYVITIADWVHPDIEGSKVIAKNLSNFLLNYFGKSYFLV